MIPPLISDGFLPRDLPRRGKVVFPRDFSQSCDLLFSRSCQLPLDTYSFHCSIASRFFSPRYAADQLCRSSRSCQSFSSSRRIISFHFFLVDSCIEGFHPPPTTPPPPHPPLRPNPLSAARQHAGHRTLLPFLFDLFSSVSPRLMEISLSDDDSVFFFFSFFVGLVWVCFIFHNSTSFLVFSPELPLAKHSSVPPPFLSSLPSGDPEFVVRVSFLAPTPKIRLSPLQ